METLKALILTIIVLNLVSKGLSFYYNVIITGSPATYCKQFIVPFRDSNSRPELLLKFYWIKKEAPVLQFLFSWSYRPQAWNFIKNEKLRHRCFPFNSAKFLRTPFLIEHHRQLLLHRAHERKLRICYPFSVCVTLQFIVLNQEMSFILPVYYVGLCAGRSTKDSTVWLFRRVL